MVKVIYEDNHLLVVEKPVNILSQGDDTNDKDMVNLLKQYVKEKYNKPGNVYIGLLYFSFTYCFKRFTMSLSFVSSPCDKILTGFSTTNK